MKRISLVLLSLALMLIICACDNAEEHVHSYGEWEITKAATCTEEGEQKKSCSCGEIITEKIPAKNHTEIKLKSVAPTCIESGLEEGKYCSDCGEVLIVQEKTPALGHTEVTDSAIEPTCISTGLTEGKHCSVCSEILIPQEVIDMSLVHIGKGSCAHCKINYFDSIFNTIVKNGTYITEARREYIFTIDNVTYSFTSFSLPESKYICIKVWNSADDWNEAYTYRGYLRIFIYNSNIKYGEYEWCYYSPYFYDGADSVGGVFKSADISPEMPVNLTVSESEFSSTSKTNRYKNSAEDKIKDLLNVGFPKLLSDSNTNITMANLGFERFED